MQWFWTWGGKSFGYRQGNSLFTHDGREVGRFNGEEVYGKDGRYLGEIKGESRLITNQSKRSRGGSSFSPMSGGAYVQYTDYVGYVMYAGYEDFPVPDEL